MAALSFKEQLYNDVADFKRLWTGNQEHQYDA